MKRGLIIIFLFFLLGCENGAGTGVSNPPSNPNKTINGAVAALFSSGSDSNITASRKIPHRILRVFVRQAVAQEFGEECGDTDPGCTCQEVLSNGRSEDSSIQDEPFTDPGIYGAAGSTITVDEDDFCTQPDGETENSTMGPDGVGRFASFTLADQVTGTCTDSDNAEVTLTMESGSSGIWRNTNETEDAPAHEPEIYGTFILQVSGESAEFDCTIIMGTGESVLSATCSDELGEEVEQDVDSNCVFDSGEEDGSE